MKRALFILLFPLSVLAGSINLQWESVTQNVDGSIITDPIYYKVYYAPVTVQYAESNGLISWMETSTGSYSFVVASGTNVTLYAPSAVYSFKASACAYGVESEYSSSIVARVGSPSTLKLRKVK